MQNQVKPTVTSLAITVALFLISGTSIANPPQRELLDEVDAADALEAVDDVYDDAISSDLSSPSVLPGNDSDLSAMPELAPASDATRVITGVRFNTSSHRRLARGSDNWPLTWSNDGQQYAMWGDGGGFNGGDSVGRASFGVARIEGDHDSYRGVNRHGGRNAECTSSIHGKAHGAPISVRGVLYAWVTPRSNSAGYQRFTLYKSTNKGCTWNKRSVAFTLARDGVSFGSFVQAGRDSSLAQDAYVYTVAPAVTNTSSLKIVQRPGRIMLMRVPAASMEDRGAYQFYAGKDSTGQPIWSSSAARKRPIYRDSNGVGPFPQVSFVPGLGRWVYTNQHGNGKDLSSARSRLTMGEAAQPWGPYSVFYKGVFFPKNEQRVFQWSFAPKWFRNSGRNFTLTFSGDNTNDSWNTIDGTFVIAP